MTPVAAVDIGSNSTRLLITDGRRALARESIVTGLGEGVDATGRLGEAPIARVLAVLERFRARSRRTVLQRAAAVMTSAVRDAANGAEFAARVSATLGFPARILSGDDEARLTYAGATYGREPGEYLVIDIGGGSTELVLGAGFHVSTQIGVVRHSERHLHADPPDARGAGRARGRRARRRSWRTSRCVRAPTRRGRSRSPERPRSARRSTSDSSRTTRRGSRATSSPVSACASCWTEWPRFLWRSGARSAASTPPAPQY